MLLFWGEINEQKEKNVKNKEYHMFVIENGGEDAKDLKFQKGKTSIKI